MKKNKVMRFASVVLVMTLLSTCMVGGTFAKYTTTATGSDTARVAKWGFTEAASLSLDDLFKNVYAHKVDSAKNSVKSETSDVIAPGTQGSDTFGFTYAGGVANAPEVAYTFSVSTAGSACADDIKNNSNIKWRLDTGAWGTWDDLLNAIEALDGATGNTSKDYEPGELPAAFNAAGANTHTVEWKWAFDVNDDITGFDASDVDATDTFMGNGSVDALAVTLKITVTATQID